MKKYTVTITLLTFLMCLFSCTDKASIPKADSDVGATAAESASETIVETDTQFVQESVLQTEDASEYVSKTFDNVEWISVKKYIDPGSSEYLRIPITEKETIFRICEIIESLTLVKMDYIKPCEREFEIIFYDAASNKIENVSVPAFNEYPYIVFGDDLYYIAEGKFDAYFINGLFFES